MSHAQEVPEAGRLEFWLISGSLQNCIIMKLARKRGYHTQAEHPGNASTWQERSVLASPEHSTS